MRRLAIAVLAGGALLALGAGAALWSDLIGGAGGGPALTRDDVRQAQHRLKTKGLYDGRVDGVIGPATADALQRYQHAAGLPETARLDAPTAERLIGAKLPETLPETLPGAPPVTPSDAGASGQSRGAAAGGRDATAPPLPPPLPVR